MRLVNETLGREESRGLVEAAPFFHRRTAGTSLKNREEEEKGESRSFRC